MTGHSINRSGTAGNSHDNQADDDSADGVPTTSEGGEDNRSEVEIKREFRKSPIGQALVQRKRELERRNGGRH